MTNAIPLRNLPSHGSTNDKIYPRRFQGVFRRLRIAGGSFLFLLFFGTAWLGWNGRQAVLWDLSGKQFHIFGSTFWPQDLALLSAILIICAFGLFFLTVAAGRVWCGYSCPQSVWMWLFLWVERVTEGDRNRRRKLDQAPLSRSKLARRAAKHSLWLAISLITAITFVGYFTPIRALVADLATLQAGGWAAFWVFFFTAATYLNAGWLREKVCVHMCPYGRFQSTMLDRDSLVISYDAARGEPRGHRKTGTGKSVEGLGDCIDCQMCVQVCPTGIDIRDGLQMECIGCAACIDACDSIMEKIGAPTGLVRYTSERELSGGKLRVLRPRLLGYGGLLAVFIGVLVWAIASRPLVDLDVTRDRGLYRFNAAGEIENSYTLKILNKAQHPRLFEVWVSGVEGLRLLGGTRISAGAGERVEVPVSVSVPAAAMMDPITDIKFHLQAIDSDPEIAEKTTRFIGAAR